MSKRTGAIVAPTDDAAADDAAVLASSDDASDDAANARHDGARHDAGDVVAARHDDAKHVAATAAGVVAVDDGIRYSVKCARRRDFGGRGTADAQTPQED